MIRFFNGRTLTMAHGVTVTTDEVWTDGDKIAYVGPTPETLPAFEREIDLGGDLVMPGLQKRARARRDELCALIRRRRAAAAVAVRADLPAGGQAHARGGVCVYEAVDP